MQPAADAGYGREHHDYPATDIFAPCGSSAVAPIDGTVDEVSLVDQWDPAVDDPATRGGLSVSLVGVDGVRYYGSHLASIADPVQPGAPILAGSPLGTVGQTGNAATTPCHLHFGISPPGPPGDWQTRRGVVWPWPYLDAWRQGENLSPQAEVAAAVIRLDELVAGAAVDGVDPAGPVTVVSAQWHGTQAMTLTFPRPGRNAAGAPALPLRRGAAAQAASPAPRPSP